MNAVGSVWSIDLSGRTGRAAKLRLASDGGVCLLACKSLGVVEDTTQASDWAERVTQATQALAHEPEWEGPEAIFVVIPPYDRGKHILSTFDIPRDPLGNITRLPGRLASREYGLPGYATDANQELIGLQIAPLAIYNFVSFEGQATGDTAIIDLGPACTSVVVTSPRSLTCHLIPIGGNSFTKAIAQKTGSDFHEAEQLRHSSEAPSPGSAVFEAMLPTVRTLIQQIQDFIASTTRATQGGTLRQARFHGARAGVSGMKTFLADALDCPVEEVGPPQCVQVATDAASTSLQEDAVLCARAIGGGLQAMGQGPVKAGLWRSPPVQRSTGSAAPWPCTPVMRKRLAVPLLTVAAAVLVAALIGVSVGRERGAGESRKRPEPGDSGDATGKRYALLVAVEDYEDDNIGDLSYAIDDVSEVGELLVSHGQFDKVFLMADTAGDANDVPSRVNILRTLKWLSENLKPADTLLFMFAGHGETDGDVNFLIPVDGYLDLPRDTSLPLRRVLEWLDLCPARRQIVILDACHSGLDARKRGRGLGGLAEAFERELASAECEGRAVLSSCGKGEVAYEDRRAGHGVFTSYVLRGLRGAADANGDGGITVHELNQYVRPQVLAWCRQNRKSPTQTPRAKLDDTAGSIVLAEATKAERLPVGEP